MHNFSNIPIINNIFDSELSITADYEGEAIHLEKSHCLIRDNSFTNQRNAISISDDYTKFGASRIIDNTFNDNLTAIRIEGSNMVKIEENSINIGSLTLGSDYNFGVRIIGSSGIQVLNNEFSSDFDSNVFFIAANDTNDDLASEFKYNSFGSKGNVAYRAIELQGDHRMLQMFCNDFTMTSDVEFAIGLENGALLMPQGRLDAPAGNDWSNIGICDEEDDESQIYKTTTTDVLYYTYQNKSPDCTSNGVIVEINTDDQLLSYCQIPLDPDCGGTFPRVCDLAILAEIQDTIRFLIDNPIFSKPQEEREAEIKYFEHQLLSIVQSNIIDKITEDSIDQVLIYLDSIKSLSPVLQEIHDALLEKYTEPLLRPSATNDNSYYYNLRTFIPEVRSPSEFIPLIMQVNNFQKEKRKSEKDVEVVGIQVLPNPADGQTIIRLLNGEKEDLGLKSISIYNSIGQLILFADTYNSQSFQFNVTSYDIGLYLILVEDTDNQFHVKKLIVQH